MVEEIDWKRSCSFHVVRCDACDRHDGTSCENQNNDSGGDYKGSNHNYHSDSNDDVEYCNRHRSLYLCVVIMRWWKVDISISNIVVRRSSVLIEGGMIIIPSLNVHVDIALMSAFTVAAAVRMSIILLTTGIIMSSFVKITSCVLVPGYFQN